LLDLAAKSGCTGVFIGFESPDEAGLAEINKRFNLRKGTDFRASVRRIHRHGIVVVGSFIMGLDVDEPGVGRQIAEAASRYGVDILNLLILTPLPGTRLWETMEQEGRIAANTFPDDWKYYTLTFPVARHKHLSWTEVVDENEICNSIFFSYPRIVSRLLRSVWRLRKAASIAVNVAGNLAYRGNAVRFLRDRFVGVDMSRGRVVVDRDRPALPGS